MRHPILVTLGAALLVATAGCDKLRGNDVDRKILDVNVVDETNLNDVMLTVSDPNEAVRYFQRALANDPDRVDLMRGVALSLIRAKRPAEAVSAWTRVTKHKEATNDDRVELADALIRSGEWERAAETLNTIPPTDETFKRYRLEAMVADSREEWKKADSFYEIAVGLTTTPASTLNNWGYSKLTRGDTKGAETLFAQAIRQDPTLFTAKNNLDLARGAQGNYAIPVLPMPQTERAQLLHTAGLAAIKRGDVATGRALFREAMETHPQHFEAAARSLEALEANVTN
jgi:Flp pilus assembly protein TadD